MDSIVQHSKVVAKNLVLTKSAQQRILTYLAENGHRALRLSVKKTGCSGLSYVMDYVDTVDQNDVVIPLKEDHCVCIAKASYPYLSGLKLDYVKQGLVHKFVFENPNQTGQCGCGESFTVD